MQFNPKVSIIMATYNRAHLIEETLVSIQNQTYKNWECLIIDDGGNDNTNEVLAPFLKSDSRFQFHQRPEKYKKGLPGCRNYGLDIAKGEGTIFFDDDDIVHPQNLEICVHTINNTNKDFVVFQKKSFTEIFNYSFKQEKLSISEKKILLVDVLMNKTPMASCTVFWVKNGIDHFRFNEHLMYAEEWEFYIRLLINKKQGILIDNVLYFNRKHTQSNTGEFWNNDPIRIASKVEACRLVINHLAQNKLLTYRLGVYFVSLAYFYKEKQIFNFIKENKEAFNTFENLMLKLRYYANGFISPFYKLKRSIAFKS